MEHKDIRWKQRFANYNRALKQLARFIDKRSLNELEEQGLIQCFEYTWELAWKTIKDFYEHQGEEGIQGSRDAVRLAFKRGLIANGETWMDMLKSRNRSLHTYNEEVLKEISEAVFDRYWQEFINLQKKLEALSAKG